MPEIKSMCEVKMFHWRVIYDPGINLQLLIKKQMNLQLQSYSELFQALFQNNLYEKAIKEASRKYKIKHYRIEKLTPTGINHLLRKNLKKQKPTSIQENNYVWAEGQLKIFIWALVGYVYIRKIEISDMNQSDFHLFTQIFNDYSTVFLHYQAKFLLRRSDKVVWTQTEVKLLNEIIKAKFLQKNWNTVAFELYLISDKTIFRTPKQCRERWLNHEDPIKKKSEWTIQEDIELLRFVRSHGKKWSHIAKSMKSIRTQHMVKNRLTSLLKKVVRTFKSTSQQDLIENLIKQKKVEREEKRKHQQKQTQSLSDRLQAQPQSTIQLQEIENPYEDVDCTNFNQKLLEYLQPNNLVAELEKVVPAEPMQLVDQCFIDFFEEDQLCSTEGFLDWFF